MRLGTGYEKLHTNDRVLETGSGDIILGTLDCVIWTGNLEIGTRY